MSAQSLRPSISIRDSTLFRFSSIVMVPGSRRRALNMRVSRAVKVGTWHHPAGTKQYVITLMDYRSSGCCAFASDGLRATCVTKPETRRKLESMGFPFTRICPFKLERLICPAKASRKVVLEEPEGPAMASTSLWFARAVTLLSKIFSLFSLLYFDTTYTQVVAAPSQSF